MHYFLRYKIVLKNSQILARYTQSFLEPTPQKSSSSYELASQHGEKKEMYIIGDLRERVSFKRKWRRHS
jgi:hypothetical protein